MATQTSLDQSNIGSIRDVDWVARSFLLAGERIEKSKELRRWRKFSSADTKFTGSGLGQHTVINPSPMFTPLADVPRQGLWVRRGEMQFTPGDKENIFFGMGRGYAEGIDDNMQVVHMRFGKVHYKGLITFFVGFYDAEAANMARYGRSSIGYYAGLTIGLIATLPLSPLILVAKVWNYFVGRSSSKFADFKQTMPLYWTKMQIIYNILGANLGVIARTWENEGTYGKGADSYDDLVDKDKNSAYRRYMAKLMPDLFTTDGRIDIFNVANSAAKRQLDYQQKVKDIAEGARSMVELRQRLLDMIDTTTLVGEKPIGLEAYLTQYHTSVAGSIADMGLDVDAVEDETSRAIEAVSNGTDPEALNRLGQIGKEGAADGNVDGGAITENQGTDNSTVAQMTNTNGFVAGIEGLGLGNNGTDNSKTGGARGNNVTTEIDANGNPISAAVRTGPEDATTIPGGLKRDNEYRDTVASGKDANGAPQAELREGWFRRLAENAETEWKQGAAFINIAVNYTGSSSMSVSNSLTDIGLKEKFNGISQTARNARISLADYKTGFGFIDSVTQELGGLISGVSDSLAISGLMALAGNAFVDMPQQWDNSNVQLPTASFELEVRTTNPGNPISAYLNLYPVVAALLAGALPESTGPQSFTSPFVCECYCQGLVAIRMGMITDLTITAGAGNLGYTKDRRPLAFNISFTVADMSSMMHMGTSNGFNVTKPLQRTLDDDSVFLDYLSTISGVHMRDMTNPHRKLAIRVAARMQDYKAFFSPEHVASRIFGSDGILGLNKMFGPTNWPGV